MITLPGDWVDHAACAGQDPAIWFPEGHGRGCYDQARLICGACPVQAECLNFALRCEGLGGRAFRAGMFGGLTPKARHAIREAPTPHQLAAITRQPPEPTMWATCQTCHQRFVQRRRRIHLYCSPTCRPSLGRHQHQRP